MLFACITPIFPPKLQSNLAEAVTLKKYTPKEPDSILSRDALFLSSSRQILGQYLEIRYDQFLFNPFKFLERHNSPVPFTLNSACS